MTAQQIADELLREWQNCPSPPAERLADIDYEKEMMIVRLSFNYESDRACADFKE